MVVSPPGRPKAKRPPSWGSDPQQGDIVPVAVISLVLAFLATLYPSWRASRVNPAEALRYE